jgi:5-methylthioadenosine/S-adenosylhomocysteine deaminase
MGVLTEALPDELCPPFTFGTRNGALNLGLDAGELREGALADMIAIDPFEVSLLPNQDLDTEVLLNNLVYAGSIRSALRDVFVGGRDVVRNGELTTVDLGEVRQGVAAYRS